MVGLGLGFGRVPVHGHALDSVLDLNPLYLPPEESTNGIRKM
jgi:hypothetical protein